jgi:hypothetical protein
MKWYLAGPMSGIPQYNIPAFDAAAAALRAQGADIVSPAELDDPEIRAASLASPDGLTAVAGKTWGDFLARDVKLIADQVDGILLMPGWIYSKGARLEAFVGLTTGKRFAKLVGDEGTYAIDTISAGHVRYLLTEKLAELYR